MSTSQEIRAKDVKKTATTPQAKKKSYNDDESYWDKKEGNTHIGTGQRKTLHGIIFQMKHLMLILLRARKMKNISDYDLASEIESAGNFDDMVFKYTENVTANCVNSGNTDETKMVKTHLFVQLKHHRSGFDGITWLMLLKDTSFGLKKYFNSWLKICEHEDFKSSRESNKFILSTNRKLSTNFQKEEVISAVDNFLNPERGVEKRFRLKVEEPEEKLLHDEFNSETQVQQLAQALVDVCAPPKKVPENSPSASSSLITPLLKKYQVALAEFVIDIENKRICDDFRTGESSLPPKVKNFRDIFFRRMYVRKYKETDSKNYEKYFEEDLKSQRLDIPDGFDKGTEVKQELPDDGNQVTLEQMREFLRAFHLVVEQPDERELGNMMQREFIESRKFKLLNNNFVLNYFEKNVWNWFKRKTGHFFTHEDVEYFIGKAERELSSLITVGLNLSHLAELKEHYDQFRLRFKQYETNKELRNFLETPNTELQILQLISSEPTVSTATRLYKAIKKDKNFVANDSFLFIHWKKLLSPDVKEHVLRAFESPSSHYLLVIDCGLKSVPKGAGELATKEWNKFWNKFGKIKKYRGCTKRLILITGRKCSVIKSERKILYANGDKLETRPATSILKTVKPIG